MQKKILLVATLFFSSSVFALALNEKLTFSILNISDSKSTVLINKGKEDGLDVGDHAKFYTTSGVVARAVVAQSSNNRSVWSIYRVINDSLLAKGNAFNLKIVSAVKVTDDPFAGAEEQKKALENTLNQEQKELADLKMKEQGEYKQLGIRFKPRIDKSPWEIFGEFHYSMLSQSTKGEEIESNGSSNAQNFSFGIEYYLFKMSPFVERLSLVGFIENSTGESVSIQGDTVKNTVNSFGAGINYHFNDPRMIEKMIWYLGTSGTVGTSNDEVSINRTNQVVNEPYKGTTKSVSLGGGFKYLVQSGLAVKLHADYYTRSEVYDPSETSASFIRQVSGMRFKLGMAWRF